MLETGADDLITEDGKIVGAKAKNLVDGTEYTIHADAVVIATGGFLGNTQMQQEHFNTPIFPLGNTVSDGTGIQMVLDAGGALDRPFAVLGNECGAVSPATDSWPFSPEWKNLNEHYG